MSSKDFKFWTLGGSGEVGMNSLILQFGDTLLPIDAGVLFADPNDFGIESLHADYDTFFKVHRPDFWLITHAHEDHIGAVAALIDSAVRAGLKIPTIYAPVFACELIREKILDDTRYKKAKRHMDSLVPVEPDSVVNLGNGLQVRFIEARHSTLQCCALAIEWTAADESKTRVLHSSDFKIDENIYEDGSKGLSIYENAFDGAPVDFLLIDSTNAERDGHTVAEKAVLPNLKRLIEKQVGRVYVSMFSSNVYRMSALMSLSDSLGRSVCLAGRSFNTVHRISRDKGLYDKYCPPMNDSILQSPEEIARKAPREQLIICSGSQGEYRSVLNRLSQGRHPDFLLQEGDAVVLSSKTIPGNEKSISRMINGLLRQGAQVFWGDYAKVQAGGPIHGSGHARRDEIRAVMNAVRPANIIPVHGELRQLKACGELAVEAAKSWDKTCDVHVCENLTRLSFAYDDVAEAWTLLDREVMPYEGRILRFGDFTAHSLDPFLRVRKRSAQGGVLSICLDSMGRSKINISGLLPAAARDSATNLQHLEEGISRWLSNYYKTLQRDGIFSQSDKTEYEELLADEVTRYVRRVTGVRPFVICHLLGL